MGYADRPAWLCIRVNERYARPQCDGGKEYAHGLFCHCDVSALCLATFSSSSPILCQVARQLTMASSS